MAWKRPGVRIPYAPPDDPYSNPWPVPCARCRAGWAPRRGAPAGCAAGSRRGAAWRVKDGFDDRLRWNAAYYRLARGICATPTASSPRRRPSPARPPGRSARGGASARVVTHDGPTSPVARQPVEVFGSRDAIVQIGPRMSSFTVMANTPCPLAASAPITGLAPASELTTV